MPRALGLFLVLSFVVALWPATAPAADSPTATDPLLGTSIRSVYLRLPAGGTQAGQPLQVLLALHGMGGNGEAFASNLTDQADRYGWLLVAPSIDYGDWRNPDAVASEDPVLIQAIGTYLDQLPDVSGMSIRRQVLILGHSRGAQLAHRFAEFRPDKVLAVAAISAGTYTLPQGFNFPYGVQDMARYVGHSFDPTRFSAISFWVGVGGQDTNAADLPRQWDSIEGNTRLQRAQAFEQSMQELGANSVLRIFSNTRHELTGEMRAAACDFLEGASTQDSAPATTN